MNILISGGSGFLGRALTRALVGRGDQVWVLTRKRIPQPWSRVQFLHWDGRSPEYWGTRMSEMDAVIHLAGKSLASWPWTKAAKQAFYDSRLLPGQALVEAIEKADRRPRIFIQQSGINHYGLQGPAADESTPPADDFLARLTVEWEKATARVEDLGLRRVITRSAVVLARSGGMLPLMALPVYFFVAGPIGGGRQAMPWIHISDWVKAVLFLMQKENARGPFNMIAPQAASNAQFYRTFAGVLHRPYWFPTPVFLLRLVLGPMSVLIANGRYAQPRRLMESGYEFQFGNLEKALIDLYSPPARPASSQTGTVIR